VPRRGGRRSRQRSEPAQMPRKKAAGRRVAYRVRGS
jgi:hypothetical protein